MKKIIIKLCVLCLVLSNNLLPFVQFQWLFTQDSTPSAYAWCNPADEWLCGPPAASCTMTCGASSCPSGQQGWYCDTCDGVFKWCTKTPVCGDGIEDDGENCDDGWSNSNTTVWACRTNCQSRVEDICGNASVGWNEACDGWGNPAQWVTCAGDCLSWVAVCGDGLIGVVAWETCDAGWSNSWATWAACTPVCNPPTCGDGHVNVVWETCDDWNDVNTDGCTNACKLPVCWDSIIQDIIWENCDDGNTVNTDSCRSTCQTSCATNSTCLAMTWANSDTSYCDLSNVAIWGQCRVPICGDGEAEWVEHSICELTGSTTSCSEFCTELTSCGDGKVVKDSYLRTTETIAWSITLSTRYLSKVYTGWNTSFPAGWRFWKWWITSLRSGSNQHWVWWISYSANWNAWQVTLWSTTDEGVLISWSIKQFTNATLGLPAWGMYGWDEDWELELLWTDASWNHRLGSASPYANANAWQVTLFAVDSNGNLVSGSVKQFTNTTLTLPAASNFGLWWITKLFTDTSWNHRLGGASPYANTNRWQVTVWAVSDTGALISWSVKQFV